MSVVVRKREGAPCGPKRCEPRLRPSDTVGPTRGVSARDARTVDVRLDRARHRLRPIPADLNRLVAESMRLYNPLRTPPAYKKFLGRSLLMGDFPILLSGLIWTSTSGIGVPTVSERTSPSGCTQTNTLASVIPYSCFTLMPSER